MEKFSFVTNIKPNKLDEKTTIKGLAIDAGVSRNNVKYLSEELQMATDSLIGKPILDNHNDSSVRNIIGKVTDAKFKDDSIFFEAVLDEGETDIIRKVNAGLINSVSISGDFDREHSERDGNTVIPHGIKFDEMSLVIVPGVSNASIHQVLAEKLQTKEEYNMDEVAKLQEKITSLEAKLSEQDAKLAKKVEEDAAAEAEAEALKEEERFKSLESKINDLTAVIKEKGKTNENKDSDAYKNFNLVREKVSGNTLIFSRTPEALY